MNRLLIAALIVSCAATVYGAFTPDAAPPSTIALTAASLAEPAPVVPVEPAAPEPAPAFWRDYASAYAEVQVSPRPLVVLFGMQGCAPCAEVKAELEADKQDGVVYCYVDVIEEPEVAKNFGYVPPGYTVPQTFVYHLDAGQWKVTHFSGRPVRGAISGAVRLAKAGVKRVAQAAKAVAEKPVEFFQERQPVRRVLRRLCPNCR